MRSGRAELGARGGAARAARGPHFVTPRVFLLSPASATGARGRLLLGPRAGFDLALRLRHGGAPLGEVFSFVSSLYFRGKLTYAERFAAPTDGGPGVLVITPDRGLVPPETPLTRADLQRFARVPIDVDERRYTAPLERDAARLRARLPERAEVVLLGSLATPRYVEPLLAALGPALRCPADFVGRGDMSRGGLLLRAARAGVELDYRPVDSGPRRGVRPPKLPPTERATGPTTRLRDALPGPPGVREGSRRPGGAPSRA